MEIILEAACIGMGKAVYFIIADLGAIVFLKWGYPLLRQKAGDREVRVILAKLPDRYRTMSDLVLKTAHEVLQIDHMVVSPEGVFVIMTKHHEGLVSGNAKEQYWTHALNNKKTKFYNPTWQNRGNIQAVKKVLKDYPDSVYSSIVAFSRRADVSGVSSDAQVVYFDQLADEILKKRPEEPLTVVQVESIAMALERRNVRDGALRKEYAGKSSNGPRRDRGNDDMVNYNAA